MFRLTSCVKRTLLAAVAMACCSACDACVLPPLIARDAGAASSSSGGGASAAVQSSSASTGGSAATSSASASGAPSGSAGDGGVDAGRRCHEGLPGFGDACGECGAMGCDRYDRLVCNDPGFNACGVCGSLDMDGGIVGRNCGTCGVVGCADGGLATLCTAEHEPNACGGCSDLPDGRGPPDAGCSTCGTGTWKCQVSRNDVSCWQGRAMSNRCGSCERCIVAYADMADLSEGDYVRSGTRAVIDDVGGDVALGTSAGQSLLLTFDPLVLGPGGGSMEGALVYLSPTELHTDSRAFALSEFFDAVRFSQPADPVRQFHLYFPIQNMRYIIIFETFLGRVVSRGALRNGAPPP